MIWIDNSYVGFLRILKKSQKLIKILEICQLENLSDLRPEALVGLS